MKLSELKKKIEELTKDLPDEADPDILIVEENRFSSELKDVSLESWDIYQDRLLHAKIRIDYIMYLEAE